jgi:simple sugar transport system permease protein
LIFVSLANLGISPVIAFFITLAACSLIGVTYGLIVVKLGIPSFIVTLAGMMGIRGLHVILTKGFLVAYQADKSFLNMLAGNPFSSFHYTIVWWLGIAIVLQLILARYKYGNWVYATGGNPLSARNTGVPVPRVKITNFAICSMLAGLGGLMNIARFFASQSQLGSGLEFEAITACVIGGVLLTGGKGSILGVFLGSVFMSVIRTGLISMGLNSYIYMPITGFILLGAVILNKSLSRQQ